MILIYLVLLLIFICFAAYIIIKRRRDQLWWANFEAEIAKDAKANLEEYSKFVNREQT